MSAKPHSHPAWRKLSRRGFLAAGALSVAVACVLPRVRRPARRHFTGGIVGANSALGHAMRDGKFPAPTETAEVGIVIVGGGIGGLAAARQFKHSGFNDFTLLELETRAGGNAVCGENEISAYPWGAHYVPIPGKELTEVRELFEELKIIRGYDGAGLPIYDEELLCADPMERLFIHGRWQEGFVPQVGVSSAEQRVIDSFFAEMRRFKSAKGSDGRRVFTIPLDESSRDEEFTRLDGITMAEYLRRQGWLACEPLRWYVNYCCRDDYGAGIEAVSAWAGVHYFASRDAHAANAATDAVVTWPEGNGWLARQLEKSVDSHIRRSCVAWNVEPNDGGLLVDYYDAERKTSVRLRAHGVVWAAPHFVARRVISSLRARATGALGSVYSPWMVANLTLDKMPAGKGMDLAWDNVMFGSDSLGYVVATHQMPERVPIKTVITYYQPLDQDEPALARQKALNRTYDEWCEAIVADLASVHPDIADHLAHLDVWLWGHGMIRPVPGFIWGSVRALMKEPVGNIVFAHSDLSGISIFEEAYTRGVRAAKTLLQNVNRPSTVS